MGFKKMETNFTFTDISLFTSMEHNRAIARMEQINTIIDWSRIENLLMNLGPLIFTTMVTVRPTHLGSYCRIG